MFAMFHLGSPDILPVGDLGVRKVRGGAGRHGQRTDARKCSRPARPSLPGDASAPAPPRPCPCATLPLQGMQLLYGLSALPSPAEMEQLAAPWAPHRSVGAYYMWRAAEAGGPAQRRRAPKAAAGKALAAQQGAAGQAAAAGVQALDAGPLAPATPQGGKGAVQSRKRKLPT
jgi:hypothetical protein